MGAYQLAVVSFDSVSLQTSDLESWFERGDGVLDTFPAQNVDVDVPGSWPQRVDVQYTGKAFPVHIRLKDTTSTKLLALQKLFRAGQGVKLLKATDGAGTTLRLSCESLGLLSTDNAVEFIARLWATKPLWEKDTAITSAHLNCAGDSHTIALVNNGSAPAKPVITVKFNAAKTKAGGPAFFRNRCLPNICTNALTDPDGEGYPTLVKSALDTATLIKNTAIYNLINGAIDASVTTIVIDGAVGGGLPTGSGMAMFGTEQIYYAANNSTQLTGCVRGIGGTTAASHADNLPIYASKVLANGNDLLVWVDGVKVDRWFGTGATAWNTATTNIWANIPWVARRTSRTVAAMTAADPPAVTDSIEFTTDISTWPAAGYFYTLTNQEVIFYASRIGKTVYGIKRAQKGTAAQTHGAGAYCFVIEHDIRYTYGDAGAGSPPADTNLQPMIDLGISTLALWAWPTDYREDATLRSAQWQQGYENKNALCVKLRGYESASKMYVEDSLPEAGKPNRNTWSIALPAGCTAIHHDVAVPPTMILQVWGDDGEALKLLKEYTSANDGDGEVITPAATIYGLQYRALLRTVTGARLATVTTDVALANSSTDRWGQALVLTVEAVVTAISVRLKKSVDATGDVRLDLQRLGGSGPTGGVMAQQTIALSSITTGAYGDVIVALPSPLHLPAGSYCVTLYRTSGGTGTVHWAWGDKVYAAGNYWDETSPTWVEYGGSFDCALIGDGSVCQDDAPSGSGEEVTIDDIELTLTTPFMTVSALSERGCYLWEALLTLTHADATVQTLSLLVPAVVGEEMEIDCEAQTVINKTTGESVAFGITASDKGWFDVISTTDSLAYAEAGMTDTDVTVVHRDTYSA